MVHQESIQPGMYVREQSFAAHLAYLTRAFHILSLEDLLDLWCTDRLDEGKRYCVVTFDDGWRDNYQYAFPLLLKYKVPATVFLATDFIGTARWFWPDQMMLLLEKAREHAGSEVDRKTVAMALTETIGVGQSLWDGTFTRVESGEPIEPGAIVELCKRIDGGTVQRLIDRLSLALRMKLPVHRVLLNWDEVRAMAEQGMTFGSHSCSHRIMTQIPLPEVKAELIESRKTMLQQGVKPVPVFCYPNGDFDRDIQALVRESGYSAAVGCEVGLERDKPCDLFALKRISLHEDSSATVPLLAFAISGFR
jgi:peptidoglycan/xylan/chitin deacetylase (PgdA/CDA1 family)